MDTLRWLHLSDVHFSDGESYEIKRMRDSIIDKMKEVFEKNKVDFVVLSGDLAYQGGGYDANLKKFIESLVDVSGVSIDELFIVPGNHDLKRTQMRSVLLNGMRTEQFKFEKETIEQLQKDFKKYMTFYNKVKGENSNYIYRLVKKEKYNIFLMNTAFTAGTDEDDGKLILEIDSFYNEIKQLKDQENCINIAIGHHPISCFMNGIQKKIWNNFNDFNIDFYLCGHLHKGAYDYDLSGGRTIPTYQCGSGRVDNYATVTFIIGELDMDTKKGKLISYKWLKDEECWAIGGIDGRRAVPGEMEINLDRFKQDSNVYVEDEDLDEDETGLRPLR